jgi:hypothetical protein
MFSGSRVEHRRSVVTVLSIAVLGMAVTGCVSAEEQQQRDAGTCQSFGAPFGSRAYTDCMLEQQSRRDRAQMDSLERTRMTQEIARNAQEMTDLARKDRCRRDPGRSECRR